MLCKFHSHLKNQVLVFLDFFRLDFFRANSDSRRRGGVIDGSDGAAFLFLCEMGAAAPEGGSDREAGSVMASSSPLSRSRMRSRISRSSSLPTADPFISVDGSVGYMHESASIPYSILRDSTGSRDAAIFVPAVPPPPPPPPPHALPAPPTSVSSFPCFHVAT